MAKAKKLNGIPGNLALSYLGTLNYFECGYMADWLYYKGSKQNVHKIEIDILSQRITPIDVDCRALRSALPSIAIILKKEVANSGFDISFIKNAILKFEIPSIGSGKIILCNPYIEDINGKIYQPKKQISEIAYIDNFGLFDKNTSPSKKANQSFLDKIKSFIS